MYDYFHRFHVFQCKSYEMLDALYEAHNIADATGVYSDFYRLRDSLECVVEPNFPRIFLFPDYEFDPNDFR